VSFFGDGAVNEGVFHEALNMAGLWKLPALFVCENNQYALSMTVEKSSALPDLYRRGSAYGIPGTRVDGNNVVAVYRAALEAAERARSGQGPALLECVTYRQRGHARFEASHYRDPAEVEAWKQYDPILRLRGALIQSGVAGAAELDDIGEQVETALEAAIAFAESSPDVEAGDYLPYIFKEASHA
jgi:pyruvate dehydrogenase E1 component alpha subunit